MSFQVLIWRRFRVYSWLSLSRILDISNFALSRTIYPAPWSCSTWPKQKNSRYLEFLLMSNKFSKTFLAILVSQRPLAQLLQLWQQDWLRSLRSNFFFFFDRMFDSIFLSLEYSMKLLFKPWRLWNENLPTKL